MKKVLLSILLTLLPLLASAETVKDGIWYNLITKAKGAEVIYKISVYATKTSYENSDVATLEIVIEDDQTTLFGDLNKDGKINVADHVKFSEIIMNK